MRRSATNILLVAICCLLSNVQSTAGAKCFNHACAGGNGKRADINDLGAKGSDIQKAREGRKGDGKERGASGGDRGDDLRSEISDLRQLLEEKELLDIANRRQTPLDTAIGQPKTAPQVHDREDEEQKEEEESPRLNSTETDRRNSIRYTLTTLRKILDDIERRLDSQPASDSVNET